MKALIRTAALVAVASLALGACGGGDEESASDETGGAGPGAGGTVAVAYDLGGRGDGGFNDLAYAGAKAAADAQGAEVTESTAKETDTDEDRAARLELLAQSGADPVVTVGYLYATALNEVAPKYPDTWFAIVDDATVDQPNVAALTFAANEGSFLVGAVAALESESGKVGFIGGVDTPLINEFEAGFLAGAEAANPEVDVSTSYLTQPPDFAGFNDPTRGKESANGQYDSGVDIIFAAAGGSNAGVFDAANGAGAKVIGVDSDQYDTTEPPLNEVIVSSMLKRVDVGVQTFIESVADGSVEAGERRFDLSTDGVGYSTSGDLLSEETIAAVDEFAAQIRSGDITVPTTVE
ncbi:BMP family ABC transporter substrate-binding protein [Nocardioides sp. cx-169]|uniref:BMP family lipoprotein n=1 Tax=Nocardioides sp. cx-169 TaxID=2899080 RepID=UPI001E2B26C2|nr:BMP family ABC transporter substrate-binding protein [Nocardioides sp. cx-169]MCD4533528.1 BMP family ABC transporter substrate-binding protein [Nocardioides sp. cx-169]